jgi:hypothetical protein
MWSFFLRERRRSQNPGNVERNPVEKVEKKSELTRGRKRRKREG